MRTNQTWRMGQQKAPISFRIISHQIKDLKENIPQHGSNREIFCRIFHSYVGINKEDFYNENFIFDIYLLVTKNLNPFSLDRKLNNPNKHEMICMIWKECMPVAFYKFICKSSIWIERNVLQPKVSEIVKSVKSVTNFLKENEKKYVLLRKNLSQYKSIFQYVYSNVYPEIYCGTERWGFDLKNTFHIVFKTYKDKKKIEQLGKNPQNYENNHAETCVFEQKPVKIDDFNKDEEKEVKESVEKRKMKRREVAEKNKLLKKKRNRRKIKRTKKKCGIDWKNWIKSLRTLKNIRKGKKNVKDNY